MTIQQAIKSGKPFRRKAWGKKWPGDWYVNRRSQINTMKHLFSLAENWYCSNEMKIRDILATDWEVRK